MKIEVEVDKDRLLVDIDGFKFNVLEDLGKEFVEDVVKKAVWFASIAYEVERRYVRFIEVEKRQYMNHWRLWALKWIRVKDQKDTSDFIDSCVADIFSDYSISNKLKYLFEINGRRLSKEYSRWAEFFNDDSVPDFLKNDCREMFKIELENKITYDKMIDIETRMSYIVKCLKYIADGYKEKAFFESKSLKSVV